MLTLRINPSVRHHLHPTPFGADVGSFLSRKSNKPKSVTSTPIGNSSDTGVSNAQRSKSKIGKLLTNFLKHEHPIDYSDKIKLEKLFQKLGSNQKKILKELNANPERYQDPDMLAALLDHVLQDPSVSNKLITTILDHPTVSTNPAIQFFRQIQTLTLDYLTEISDPAMHEPDFLRPFTAHTKLMKYNVVWQGDEDGEEIKGTNHMTLAGKLKMSEEITRDYKKTYNALQNLFEWEEKHVLALNQSILYPVLPPEKVDKFATLYKHLKDDIYPKMTFVFDDRQYGSVGDDYADRGTCDLLKFLASTEREKQAKIANQGQAAQESFITLLSNHTYEGFWAALHNQELTSLSRSVSCSYTTAYQVAAHLGPNAQKQRIQDYIDCTLKTKFALYHIAQRKDGKTVGILSTHAPTLHEDWVFAVQWMNKYEPLLRMINPTLPKPPTELKEQPSHQDMKDLIDVINAYVGTYLDLTIQHRQNPWTFEEEYKQEIVDMQWDTEPFPEDLREMLKPSPQYLSKDSKSLFTRFLWNRLDKAVSRETAPFGTASIEVLINCGHDSNSKKHLGKFGFCLDNQNFTDKRYEHEPSAMLGYKLVKDY